MLRSSEEWNRLDYDAILAADSDDEENASTPIQNAEISVATSSNSTSMSKAEASRTVRLQEKLDKESALQAESKSKLLASKAKVAQLKAKRAKIKLAKSKKESHIPDETTSQLDNEAQAIIEQAKKWEKLSKTVNMIMNEKKLGQESLISGDYDSAIAKFQSILKHVANLEPHLILPQNKELEQTSHSHGHGHGHGHICCSEGQHTTMEKNNASDDDKVNDSGERECENAESESLNQLGVVVDRSRRKGMILLGQAYIAKGMLVEAVDILRDLLRNDRDLEEGWILRGKAFLLMGCPLLAELHFTQKIVNQDSKRVQDLLATVREHVKSRQNLKLEEMLDQLEIEMPQADRNTPGIELLLRQGDILHQEHFLLSAMLKYALALRYIDDIGNGKQMSSVLILITIRCLSSLARSCVEREGADLSLAVQCCSRILRDCGPEGLESPGALLLRAKAYSKLGQYNVAFEDLIRAQRAVRLLKLTEVGDFHEKLSKLSRFEVLRGIPSHSSVCVVRYPKWKHETAGIEHLSRSIADELDQIKYLWSQVGQVSLPKNLPSLAVRVHSQTTWPGVDENAEQMRRHNKRRRRRLLCDESKPNIVFVIFHSARGSLSTILSLEEKMVAVEFESHYAAALSPSAAVATTLSGDYILNIVHNALRHKEGCYQKNYWLPDILTANGYSCELFGRVFSGSYPPTYTPDSEVSSHAIAWISSQCETANKPFCAIISLAGENRGTGMDEAEAILASLREFKAVHQNTIILLTGGCPYNSKSTRDNADIRIPLLVSNPVLFEVLHDVDYAYGDKVQVENESTGEWFNAVVTKTVTRTEGAKNKHYNVVYADGMLEEHIPKRRLRISQIRNMNRGEILDNDNDLVSQGCTNGLDSSDSTGDVVEESFKTLLGDETTQFENLGAIDEDVVDTDNVILKDTSTDQIMSSIVTIDVQPRSELITSAVDLMPTVLGLAGIKNTNISRERCAFSSKYAILLENIMNETNLDQQVFERKSSKLPLPEIMGRDLSKFLLLEETGNALLERGNFAITVSLLENAIQAYIKSKGSLLSVRYSMDDMCKNDNTPKPAETVQALSEILLRCRILNIVPDFVPTSEKNCRVVASGG